MLLAIFVIALVSAMTVGILKRLTVRAKVIEAIVTSERLTCLEEAGLAHVKAQLKQTPGYSGRLRWNGVRSGLPDSHLKPGYDVRVQTSGSDSVITCVVFCSGQTRTSTRTIRATP